MINPGTDAIRERAYQIWEREGRPHGKDFDHWLQAERELAAPAASKPSRATKRAGSTATKRAASPRTKKTH